MLRIDCTNCEDHYPMERASIRNMRWICSCGHGTSGDAMLFLHAAADGIPLLRDPMMEGLY